MKRLAPIPATSQELGSWAENAMMRGALEEIFAECGRRPRRDIYRRAGALRYLRASIARWRGAGRPTAIPPGDEHAGRGFAEDRAPRQRGRPSPPCAGAE